MNVEFCFVKEEMPGWDKFKVGDRFSWDGATMLEVVKVDDYGEAVTITAVLVEEQ